ncbi:MAG: 4-(cytidine 5'-diphospho)-2-C-methyl-D-erythritol kinase [Saprospiraceae bacterium]|nr:4-(cytidine 5'-diphospho)-2-C-methyl-D-erythritol kinase [Saprospiraceae bacterium]
MINYPNCKINLGLSVTEKRTDGFHNIETIFYPVGLCDILEIIVSPNNRLVFQASGLEIDGDANENLCVKAFELLKWKLNIPEVHIHLHKIIPFGAGLGGGSADAAFTIKLLNELHFLSLSEEEQINFAKKLGADCAFFIKNKPLFAFGKGDEFEDIEIDLKGYYIVIVKPDISVNTSLAYSQIKAQKPELSIKDAIKKPIKEWKDCLKNDFEKVVFEEYPEIKKIKTELYESGAVYASMSGSGSAVYGLFDEKPEIDGYFGNCYVWEGEFQV